VDLFDILKSIVRQWYIMVPTAIIAIVVSVQLAGVVDTEFEASGSSIFVGPTERVVDPPADAPPDAEREFEPTNPFLSFNQSIDITGSAAARVVSSREYIEQLAAEGYEGEYGITQGPIGPVVNVSSTAPSPEAAVAMVERVLLGLEVELERLQGGTDAPAFQQISLQQLTVNQEARELTGARRRVLVGGSALGLVAAASLAVAADAISARRARARPDDGGEPEAGSDVRLILPASRPADQPSSERELG